MFRAMVLASLATKPHKTQAEAAQGRTAPGKVTGRLLAALNAMVWEGLKRRDAAEKANMSEHSLYVALRRPHVKQWYLAECEVLRLSGKARRIHRLDAITEQDENKQAAVNAIRALDHVDEQAQALTGIPRIGGLVIHIHNSGSSLIAQERSTSANPLIEHESHRHDGQSDDE